MAVQQLAGGALSPTSMSGGNTISDPKGHTLGMALPGSESVNPLPDRLDQVPMPELPAQQPVNPQAGHYGGTGLPPSPPLDNGETPGAGGFSTGVQGGGNQGGGNPGAGSSGPDWWKPTISSGGRAGGPQAPGS